MNNPYCEALGTAIPRLEFAKDSPDANYFALLIVALLEHGAPMTLEHVARRLEEARIASADGALVSLKRCEPRGPADPAELRAPSCKTPCAIGG